MTEPAIVRSWRGDVAVLALNRPKQRNAMSQELVDQLIAALADLGHDPSVGAILLIGTGNGFCAGSDLGGLARATPAGRSAFEADSGRAARMIGQCPKPVVAGVHGFAIGGGFTLAAACDLVVTDRAAKWTLPEVPIGLFPAWGMGAVIARAGAPVARRLAWGIDTLDGAQAQTLGLADIVTDGDAVAQAEALCAKLASLPRAQSEAVKRYFAASASDEAGDVAANALFMRATLTPEAEASFIKFGSK